MSSHSPGPLRPREAERERKGRERKEAARRQLRPLAARAGGPGLAARWSPPARGRAGARPWRGEGLRLRTQQQPVHVKDEVSDRAQRGRRGGGGSGHGEAEQSECSRSRGRCSPRGHGRRFLVAPRGGAGQRHLWSALCYFFKQSPFLSLGLVLLQNSDPCPERLWSLPLWTYWRTIWMQFRAVCSVMTLCSAL